MTALDQAFIKAFSQQAGAPASATLRPTSPNNPLEKSVLEISGATAGLSSSAVGISRKNTAGQASSGTLAKPREDYAPANEEHVERNESVSPSVVSSPGARDIAPEMFDRFDGVLAALEKMPDLRSREPENQAADSVQAMENVEYYPVEFPSVEVDIGQWSGGGTQWVVGDESLSTPVESLLPGHEPQPSIPEPETAGPEPESPNVEYLPAAAEYRTETVEPEQSAAEPQLPETVEEISPDEVGMSCPLHRRRMFRPAWQVDSFTWPKVCRRLMSRATDEWDRLADALVNVAAGGGKVQAFAGCRQGEGATTLLLCAANRLAERGIKTALVDADFQKPRLAKRLGIQPQIGWNETGEDDEYNINQAVVETADGNLALAALRESDETNSADWLHWHECIGQLRDHYDLILVDLGPMEKCVNAQNTPWDCGNHLDVVLLTHNRRITPKETLAEMQHRLNEAGVNVAGVVENFITT